MDARVAIIRTNLQRHGFSEIALSGSCMRPILMEGDYARIIAAQKPSIGDVCIFVDNDGRLLVHRIVYLKRGKLQTKGDHSNASEWIKSNDILGIIAAIRLPGSNLWIDLPNNIFYRYAAAYLSKRMIHEQDFIHTSFILRKQKLYRRFHRYILVLLNGGKRKRMEKIAAASPTPPCEK